MEKVDFNGKMRGASQNYTGLIVLVLALGALAYMGGFLKGGAIVPGGVGGGGGVVVLPSTQNLYVTSLDFAQPGVAVGGTSSYVYKDGGLIKDGLAASTAFAVPGNADLRIFTNKSGYFSSEDMINTGTASSLYVSPKLADDTNGTLVVYNPGTFTQNALLAKAAFAASDQKTFRIDWTGNTNQYLASPKINKVVFTLAFTNNAEWSTGNIADSYIQYNGATCPQVQAPVSGASRPIAWECDILNGGTGTSPNTYYLTLKASGSGGSDQNVTLGTWAKDIYRNTLTGATGMGVEDNLGNKLHTDGNTTIFIA